MTYFGEQHHQRPLLGGWRVLGWIALLKEATKLNSNCLLEKLINFFWPGSLVVAKGYLFFCLLSQRRKEWITKQMALKELIMHKWWNEIPPSTSSKWNTVWNKAKAQKGNIPLIGHPQGNGG